MPQEIEFVYSIRSPFAWIAARHAVPQVAPDVRVRWTPFFPLPAFPNFGGTLLPAKVRYIIRPCKAYGLKVRRPPDDEDDWRIGHAACLYVDRLGRGPEFAVAAMNERWEKGELASTPEAVARVSESLGLDPKEIVDAAMSDALQGEIESFVQKNFDE